MFWKLVVIFIGGIAIDLLITKYTRSVSAGRPKTAAALSGLITLANIGIWGTIIHEAETLGIWGAISMALGASIGTLLGFKTRIQLSPPAASLEPESESRPVTPPSDASTTVTGLISP